MSVGAFMVIIDLPIQSIYDISKSKFILNYCYLNVKFTLKSGDSDMFEITRVNYI